MPHVRKPKLIDERLERYASYLVANPQDMRGKWLTLLPGARALHVDLGCGKGIWTSRVANANPDCLFIGVDFERMCVSFAMERAAQKSIQNARFIFDGAHSIEELFAPGEVDVLHMNFPTPFPRKKQARNRVTDEILLMVYRQVLSPTGEIHLKTDSQPLFDFTLEQLAATGYDVAWLTRDMHAEHAGATPLDLTMSAYEEKLVGEGARVHALHARAASAPALWEPHEPVGLAGYLPDDLESLAYVPHGMQGTVENLINQRRRARERAASARRSDKGRAER